MKQLEELKEKVLLILQKNKEVQEKYNVLKLENAKLQEQNRQLELSLMKESESAKLLVDEKNVIKKSVDELLESIGKLEVLSKETDNIK